MRSTTVRVPSGSPAAYVTETTSRVSGVAPGGTSQSEVVTDAVIREDLGWAFRYSLAAVPLALVWLIDPLFAAVAMAASSPPVVGNSARSLG